MVGDIASQELKCMLSLSTPFDYSFSRSSHGRLMRILSRGMHHLPSTLCPFSVRLVRSQRMSIGSSAQLKRRRGYLQITFLDCSSCSSSEQVFHIAGFLHGDINDSDWLHEEIWGFANALPESRPARARMQFVMRHYQMPSTMPFVRRHTGMPMVTRHAGIPVTMSCGRLTHGS